MVVMLRLVQYIAGFNEAVSPLVGCQTRTGAMLSLSSVIPS